MFRQVIKQDLIIHRSYGGIGFLLLSYPSKTFSTLLDDGKGKDAKYVVIAGGYNDMAYSYDTIKNKVYETVKKPRDYPDLQRFLLV